MGNLIKILSVMHNLPIRAFVFLFAQNRAILQADVV